KTLTSSGATSSTRYTGCEPMALCVRQSAFMHYNAGAFVSGDIAVLVDPGILADEIGALVSELDGAAVTAVVLTHSDWDHILGPAPLPQTRIVAHERYETQLDPDGVRIALGQLEQAAGVVREEPFEPPRPTETFEHELTLRVGELVLRIEHAPGHTADMVTIYEPGNPTLWAADVLSDVELPLVCHDLGDYEQTLERIAQRSIHTLVPGHGSRTSDTSEIRRRIEEDRTYLADLRHR